MKLPPTMWARFWALALALAAAVRVSAQAPDPIQSPDLKVLAPENGSSGPASFPVRVLVEYTGASDTRVRHVRVESDGVDLGEAEALPQIAIFPPPPPRFALAWPSPAVGTHRIRAVAAVSSGDGETVTRWISEPVTYTATNRLDAVDTVTVHTLAREITEGSGPQDVFELRRAGSDLRSLDVLFQLGGQATLGVDYALPFNLLRAHFDAGQDSVKVVLRPVSDTRAEGRESVVLELVQPDPPVDLLFHYRVGSPSRAESTILDVGTRPAPTVTWSRPEAGSPFNVGATVRLEVSAVDPSGYLPSVRFVATDAAGTERRVIGSSDIAFFVAPTNGTPIAHVLDWVSTNAFPGINRIRAVATTAAGETVTSPDLLLLGIPTSGTPVVRVVTEAAKASEAVPESAFVFRIERDGSAEVPLTVRYSVSGTATRGVDYQLERDPCPLCARPTILLPEGWIVLEPGVRSVRVGGTAFADPLAEGEETVQLHLEPALDRDTPYRIEPGSDIARASIEDGDSSTELPTVTIQTLDGVGSETHLADGLRFEVRRSGPTASPLAVHYRFSGSSRFLADFRRPGELAGTDPSLALPAPLVVEIPAGGNQAFLDLEVLPDPLVEGEETVVVTLVQPEPAPNVRLRPTYQVGRPEAARGLIRDTPTSDGDVPTVRITAPVAEVREPVPGSTTTAGSFLLSRTGSTRSPLTVRYTVSGTAANGRDFVYLDGDATIPAGADSRTIPVMALPDLDVESDETVVVTLSPGRYEFPADATSASASIKIHDAVGGPDPVAWIHLLTPLEGARFTLPAQVAFRALAVDIAADIRRVEFLDGDQVVGVSEHLTRDAVIPGAPRIHEWTWTNPPAGPHRLQARAEVRGALVRSETVGIVVLPQPTNAPARPHPADVATPSFTLDMAEFQSYAEAWRNGGPAADGGPGIPASFVSRAGFLAASGGRYAWRDGVEEPLAWVPGTRPSDGTGSTVAKDESVKPVVVSLSETILSGVVDSTVLDLPSLWPGGMPEREPLSFAVLEIRHPADRTNEVDLVLRLLPATGTLCQVAELSIGPGLSLTNLSDNGVHDAAAGKIRFGPFLDDANRRVTATVSGNGPLNFAGLGSFDGRDVGFRVVETRASASEPSRPRITSVERRNDGAVQVVVVDDGDAAASSISSLECSDDLVNWRRIGEIPGTAVGTSHVDSDAADAPVRYYRVSRP